MYRNRSRIEKLYAYFDAIRGNNTPVEHQVTLAILKKTMKQEQLLGNEISEDAQFEIMRTFADKFGVANPFPDKKQFLDVYRTLRDFDEVTWVDILEYGDGRGKFRVPEVLVEEMEKVFIDGFQEVLIPEAEKFAGSLKWLVDKHPDAHFTLTTMENFYFPILEDMFMDNELVDVKQTSIYEYGFTSEKFDTILAVPVFGIRDKADDKSPFISRDYDLIAAENLALHLKSEGNMAIVLPAKITFGGGRVKELRDFLQSMYAIKEIEELPSGIFESTGVKSFLLKITTGRTDEVTIKRLASDTENIRRDGIHKLLVVDDTFVLEDELTDMGDWNIDRIFESQDEDWIKFQESNVKKVELGDVASVFRGKAVSKKARNGSIGVVNISNIEDYEIDYSSLDYIEDAERKIQSYILQEGDLLMPARGTAIRVAIFKEQPYTCIASSNVIVIRALDDRLSTIYLKLFLDSPLGRKMLVARQQGTTVMNISYKELNHIEIPLPSIEEQQDIADEYNKELKNYQKTIRDAENRWSSALSRLQGRI